MRLRDIAKAAALALGYGVAAVVAALLVFVIGAALLMLAAAGVASPEDVSWVVVAVPFVVVAVGAFAYGALEGWRDSRRQTRSRRRRRDTRWL